VRRTMTEAGLYADVPTEERILLVRFEHLAERIEETARRYRDGCDWRDGVLLMLLHEQWCGTEVQRLATERSSAFAAHYEPLLERFLAAWRSVAPVDETTSSAAAFTIGENARRVRTRGGGGVTEQPPLPVMRDARD